MNSMLQVTKTSSQGTIDRVQECRDLLIGIEELSKRKEEHIPGLAVCERIVEGRRRKVKVVHHRKTHAVEQKSKSVQESLDEHKDLVMRYLKSIKRLQAAYREQILGLLKNADRDWLQHRRQILVTAFHLAKTIHDLILRKSEDMVLPCRRKRRPVRKYQAGLRSRNR